MSELIYENSFLTVTRFLGAGRQIRYQLTFSKDFWDDTSPKIVLELMEVSRRILLEEFRRLGER